MATSGTRIPESVIAGCMIKMDLNDGRNVGETGQKRKVRYRYHGECPQN
jgi:hypothetical protein